jgi:RNA polymerase sigma-70 factor, ECF subfamily
MRGAVFGEDLSDANLLRRVRKDDARAFGVLVRRHDTALRQLATRLLADRDRVDPVLLKAYGKAWRSASMTRLSSSRDDSVFNWLYRLVYNACVDELRRQSPAAPPPPPDGSRVRLPKAPAERRLAGLRALPTDERITLVLVDSEGFSIEDTARVLQRPEGKVSEDLVRARVRWRDMVIGPPPTEGTTDEADAAHAEDDATVAQSLGLPALPRGEGPAVVAEGFTVERLPVLAKTGNGDETTVPQPRSPDIAAPEDVVYAAEGAFDTDRFATLKAWFRRGRAESSTS